jgi:hypothetical protein
MEGAMRHGRDDSYLTDIPDEEPVFVIRAQDSCGAAAVRRYADLLIAVHANPLMVKSVLEHAEAMDAWPVKKLPDLG